jgi:hypothetical protein
MNRWNIALRWMPTFAGFPIGGYAATWVVGPVDALVPALAGGAVAGLIIGAAQWLGMRRSGPAPTGWIGATTVGLAIGLAAGAAAVDHRTDIGSLAIQGAFCGLCIGIAQALVLRPRLGAFVWTWPAVLAALWASGWAITTSAGIDVESQYTVFGSSGALAVTAATSVLAVVLAGRTWSDGVLPP